MQSKINLLAIYGDSISTTTHGDGGYEELLKKALQIQSIQNYAVGSSGLSAKTPNSATGILGDASNIPTDADVIIIWHGSNDWYWGSEMGILGNTDVHTFFGGIGFAVSQIRTFAPYAKLVWVNPIYRYEKPDHGCTIGNAYETKNSVSYTLYDYASALDQASLYYAFSLIDMRRLSGIHQGTRDLYLEDRVHPNKKGYEQICKVFVHELSRIL